MKKALATVCVALFLCPQAHSESLEETVKVLVDANVILSNKVLSLEERVKKLEDACLKAPAAIRKSKKPSADRVRPLVASTSPPASPPYIEEGWYYLATFKRWKGKEERIKREFERVARRLGTDVYYYIGPNKGYLVIVAKLTPSQVIKLKRMGLSPLKVKTRLPEMFSIENL